MACYTSMQHMQTTIRKSDSAISIALGVALCILLSAVILYSAPVGVDWGGTYSRLWQNVRDPYAIKSFLNPPWTLIFLPHAILDVKIGNAINLSLNIVLPMAVIKKLGGDWKSMLLVFTSPVFFDLMRVNNIEWIPMLVFFLPREFGIIALLVKPQIFGGMILIWLKKPEYRALYLAIIAILFSSSMFVFYRWFLRLNYPVNAPFDFSAFPLLVPVGLYMLWQAWQRNDDILAGLATPMLVPYIAPYSFVPYLAVLACKHKREAIVIYLILWAWVVIETRRIGILEAY